MKYKTLILTLGLILLMIVVIDYVIKDVDTKIQLSEQKSLEDQMILKTELEFILAGIDDNLASMVDAERMIKIESDDNQLTSDNKAERIQYNLAYINSLMKRNEEDITKLEALAEGLETENGMLADEVAEMRKRIDQKEGNIAHLKAQLMASNQQIEDLNITIEEFKDHQAIQEELLASYKKKLHTKHIAYGTRSSLKKRGIIADNKFRFWNKNELNPNLDKSGMNEIDISKCQEIYLAPGSIKLLSQHSIDSYEIYKDPTGANVIKVTDVELFWNTANCLVVVKKENVLSNLFYS